MDRESLILKIATIIVFFFGIALYIFLTFFVKIDLGNGYKELENIVLAAIPCILVLIYSFIIGNKKEKKKCLILYLVGYIVVMASFVFSNYRSNIFIKEGIMFREYNLIPFNSIISLFQSQLGIKFALYNIVGNFLMLTPLAILLPIVYSKFKNTKIFLFTIIIFSFSIEVIQYISGLGSLDVDDFILNVSGAFILFLIIKKTKINIFIHKIFSEQQLSKKPCLWIYVLCIIVFSIFYVKRILLVYNYYIDQKVDMTHVVCVTNTKVYLGDVENYSYYSKCDYGNSYILVGKQKYEVEDFIRSSSFNEVLFQKLNLEREIIITKAILEGKNEQKSILFEDNYSKVYLYGYTNLLIEKNAILYNLKNELEKKTINISVIHSLTELDFVDNRNGYSIEKGKYFNILTCGGNYSQYNDFYVLGSEFTITKDTCNILNSI